MTICITHFIIYRNQLAQIKEKFMKSPEKKPKVNLLPVADGNAFSIIGKVSKALKKAGADGEYINEYTRKATSGNYDHLLTVSMEYVSLNYQGEQ